MRLDTNKYSQDFTDIKEGDKVLYKSGYTHSSDYRYSVKEVTKVTGTGFRINGAKDVLFKKSDGRKKGLTSNWDRAVVSRCYNLTDEQLKEVVLKIADANLRRKLIMNIESNIRLIEKLSTDDLTKIENLISNIKQ